MRVERRKDVPLANAELVEREVAARVDVRHDGAVVNRDIVAHLDQVRLGHEPDLAAREQRTVLADRGSKGAQVPRVVRGPADAAKDTAVVEPAVHGASNGEVQLPPLAVRALVPVVATLTPAPDDDPLGADDPEHDEEGQAGEHEDEAGGDEAEEDEELRAGPVEEVEVGVEAADGVDDLRDDDGADGLDC